jgi:hypothetical protein
MGYPCNNYIYKLFVLRVRMYITPISFHEMNQQNKNRLHRGTSFRLVFRPCFSDFRHGFNQLVVNV